jgi:rhomboid domain-containing protein 1
MRRAARAPQLAALAATVWHEYNRLPGAKPACTAAALALLLAVHAASAGTPASIRGACLSASWALRAPPAAVLARFAASALTHGSDAHLAGNALSFLHKAAQLEAAWGGAALAAALLTLTLLTQVLYVALGAAGARLLDAPALGAQCAVGFSGVIFALKVICQARAGGDGWESVGGVRVPARLAAWAELVLISLVSPHASFLAHLAGICAGLLFVGAGRAAAACAAAAAPRGGARGARPAAPAAAPAAAWRCAACTLQNRGARACAACGGAPPRR